jgi:hypothetical protein
MADLDRLLGIFDELNDEKQKRVIRRVEKENEDVAKALRNLRSIRKRNKKLDDLGKQLEELK